jgi:hypothetical protein
VVLRRSIRIFSAPSSCPVRISWRLPDVSVSEPSGPRLKTTLALEIRQLYR